MPGERLVLMPRFARQCLISDGDITQHSCFRLRRWKRQDVGGLVYSAPLPIELAKARIVGKYDPNLTVWRRDRIGCRTNCSADYGLRARLLFPLRRLNQ